MVFFFEAEVAVERRHGKVLPFDGRREPRDDTIRILPQHRENTGFLL
jgi:hypothetical protein